MSPAVCPACKEEVYPDYWDFKYIDKHLIAPLRCNHCRKEFKLILIAIKASHKKLVNGLIRCPKCDLMQRRDKKYRIEPDSKSEHFISEELYCFSCHQKYKLKAAYVKTNRQLNLVEMYGVKK